MSFSLKATKVGVTSVSYCKIFRVLATCIQRKHVGGIVKIGRNIERKLKESLFVEEGKR